MKRVGFLGAYSIDNTGDQMLGYAVRQAFHARVPNVEQVLLAPAFRGDHWRHDWTRARGLGLEIRKVPPDETTAWAKGLDAVVIGGGGLIQLQPDFRPFVLGEASDWDARIPAAWNSIGAENAPAYLVGQKPFYRAVKRCCEALAYVSVRNETTLRFVRRCGFEGAAAVVPDPTMQVTLPADAADRSRAILAEAGVDPTKPVVGVSVGRSVRDPRAAGFYKPLFEALASGALSGGRPSQVVFLPFGNVYGDEELQAVAAQALPGAKRIVKPLTALERWSLVGAFSWYVCARYHAMLAAFAQGVPFVVLDEYLSDAGGTSKIRDFVVATDLDGFYLSPFLSTQTAAKLANAAKLHDDSGATQSSHLARFRGELDAHYDAMVRALRLV